MLLLVDYIFWGGYYAYLNLIKIKNGSKIFKYAFRKA